jgi:hypothetical protein
MAFRSLAATPAGWYTRRPISRATSWARAVRSRRTVLYAASRAGMSAGRGAGAPRPGAPPPPLLDAVQELRAAGAEALQIGGVRVVASTSFVDQDATVLIDGEQVSRPFRIKVIGSPQDLEPALNIPGGVVQSLEKENATVTISRPDEVTVDALRSAEQPDYAQSSP